MINDYSGPQILTLSDQTSAHFKVFQKHQVKDPIHFIKHNVKKTPKTKEKRLSSKRRSIEQKQETFVANGDIMMFANTFSNPITI